MTTFECWHFVIRQTGHHHVRWTCGGWVKLADLPLPEGETRYLGWVHLMEKHDYGQVLLALHWGMMKNPGAWAQIRLPIGLPSVYTSGGCG